MFNMTDSSPSEKQSAMQAMLALHCIEDEVPMGREYDILPQDNLLKLMNTSFGLIQVEELLAHIAYILPKIREVRHTNGNESINTIKGIVDFSLNMVNQAYKLINLQDRLYVLLIAIRKFI